MIRLVYADGHAANHPTDRDVPEYGRGYPETPARAVAIRKAVESAGFGSFVMPDDTIDSSAIAACHDAQLLHHLQSGFAESRNGPDDEQPYVAHTFAVRGRRNGRGDHPSAFGAWAFDTSAPLFAKTFEAARRASQAALTAAEHVVASGGVAYSLARPPGHHAGRDFYGGFCYLNHAAIAAEHLKTRLGGRIATLDIDYHHGNGTQEIFYADADVLTCSLHADPRQDYPFYWGGAEERGEAHGENRNLNHPLRIGTNDDHYLAALDSVLQVIADFSPRALVLSAGFDLMAGDPVPRDGGFRITTNGLESIGKRVASLKLPTVIVQEGGYNLQRLGEYAVTLLTAFETV